MSKVAVLSISMVTNALKDPKFTELLPIFNPARARYLDTQKQLEDGKGCSSCKKRRLHTGIMTVFNGIVLNMSAEDTAKFRQYFGRPIMLIAHDPKTGRIVDKII